MRAAIFDVTIEKLVDLGVQDTRHFKLTFPPGAQFDFEAGQFVNLMITTPEKVVKRSYSIASPPFWTGYIDLCIKRVEGGFVTNHIWPIKEGETLKIQGPLGRFNVRKPYPKTIVFVSTGTGIAPFRSMIHILLRDKAEVEIWNLFGNRYDTDILYQDEFVALEKEHKNFHNVFTVSRSPNFPGEKQYVQFLLPKYVPDPKDKHLYICGLTNMIEAVQKTALELGYPKENIFFEKYD